MRTAKATLITPNKAMAWRTISRISSRILVMGVLTVPSAAWSQVTSALPSNHGDTAWLLCAELIGMLAIPGIALCHAGLAGVKNAMSAALKPLIAASLVSVLWIVIGYALAFGTPGSSWIGNYNAAMLVDLSNVRVGTQIPESAFAFFQIIIAMMAAAFLCGACSGRAQLGWTVCFSGLWSLIVLAPVAHGVWGGGWLVQSVGTMDWSGGLVVRTTVGTSALTLTCLLRRIPVAGPPEHVSPISKSDDLLSILGAFLISLASLAMAGGWAMTANDDASAAMLSAYAGTAAGIVTWVILEHISHRKIGAMAIVHGMLAGSATMAAPSGYISPGAGIVIGLVGTILCHGAYGIMASLKLDDRLGVFALQGIGGMAGALLLAPFMALSMGGVGFSGNMTVISVLIAQAIGLAAVTTISVFGTMLLALVAAILFPMRVTLETELTGLDAVYHDRHEPAEH